MIFTNVTTKLNCWLIITYYTQVHNREGITPLGAGGGIYFCAGHWSCEFAQE